MRRRVNGDRKLFSLDNKFVRHFARSHRFSAGRQLRRKPHPTSKCLYLHIDIYISSVLVPYYFFYKNTE
ncbi:Hypothetical predicted protein [Octopus vulgaris]|uniref:Uncharacterized protein n=1 Tax=Octopus vulgaris TaxID=6645 RepID=A0AA36C137_OCTVU|nr:Hypothetical predicted protein [Octopus vulgaris]